MNLQKNNEKNTHVHMIRARHHAKSDLLRNGRSWLLNMISEYYWWRYDETWQKLTKTILFSLLQVLWRSLHPVGALQTRGGNCICKVRNDRVVCTLFSKKAALQVRVKNTRTMPPLEICHRAQKRRRKEEVRPDTWTWHGPSTPAHECFSRQWCSPPRAGVSSSC